MEKPDTFYFHTFKIKDLALVLKDQKLALTGKSEGFKFASLMSLDGKEFRASELEFHILGEHRIDNQIYDMEA